VVSGRSYQLWTESLRPKEVLRLPKTLRRVVAGEVRVELRDLLINASTPPILISGSATSKGDTAQIFILGTQTVEFRSRYVNK